MFHFVDSGTIGTVLESGEGVTHCVPIYDGYSIPQAISRMDLGGRDVTNYFMNMIAERGCKLVTNADREIAQIIKEKMCFVALEIEAESSTTESTVELPDGTEIKLQEELFKAPEILFNPKHIGLEHSGLTSLVHDSIMKTYIDIHRSLWSNIVLCGGNALFKGLHDRLLKELETIVAKSIKIKIDAGNSVPERKYCVWTGGSIISEMDSFRKEWVTKNQYIDEGVSRISSRGRYFSL